MFIPLPPGGDRKARRVVACVAAAVLLVALAVIPAAANAGSTKLSEPRVSARAGTTATTFTFGVTYANREGSEADSVLILIDGVAHPMTPRGSDWKNGVSFRYSTRLAKGVHSIAFRGSARDKFVAQVSAGNVTVGAAPKPPRPTPPPALGGGSTGSSGGSGATGGAPGTGSSGAPGSHPTTGGGGSTATGAPAPRTTPAPTGPPIPAPYPPVAEATSGGSTSAHDPASRGNDGVTGTTGAGDPPLQIGGWGDVTDYLRALGIGDTTPPMVRILVTFVGSAGAMTFLMAFLFFGKRRRDGEPPAPDEVLAANAARGAGQAATSTLVPPRQSVPGVPDDELGMPRWRRPSLLEARKMDPSRAVAEAPLPLSFDRGAVGPVDGHERRLIRYHVVRLLDVPDEFRSSEIGVLTHGDEVQLLERSGTYWLVLCPDGRQGWIHKMTLGEPVGAPPPPTARQTWATTTVEAQDVDEDVLLAFMTARGRA